MEQKALTYREILSEVVRSGGLISRLDLAKDARNVEMDYAAIWTDIKNGRRTGTARTVSHVESPNGGETIYIGSRQSERFVRLYNKAAQQGLMGELWARLEIELKGKAARAMAHFLLEHTDWSTVFNSILQTMIDVPGNQSWQVWIQQNFNSVALPKLERASDREKWIRQQVLPAILEHMATNPDSEAIRHLLSSMQFMVERSGK